MCKRIILNLQFFFVFFLMTFVQNQEITMPDRKGYITELIAYY